MKLKTIHYFSGLSITVFIGLHLFNHFISIFGVEAHIEWMDFFRKFYRHPILETLLLLAVTIQIVSGIKLFFGKRKTDNGFYEKLQIWTGLYLAFFLVIHLSAVMAGRWILMLDTNFYFGVAGLNTFPFNLFFIPYYALAILSFFGHVAAIHAQKMKKAIFGIGVEQQAKVILVIGFIVTLILFYGLTNGFNGLEIPPEYEVLIGQ